MRSTKTIEGSISYIENAIKERNIKKWLKHDLEVELRLLKWVLEDDTY